MAGKGNGKGAFSDPVDLAAHMEQKRKDEARAKIRMLTKDMSRDIPPEYWWVVQQTVVNLQISGACPISPGSYDEAVQINQNYDRQMAGKPVVQDRTIRLRERLELGADKELPGLSKKDVSAVVAWLALHAGDA